MAQKLNRKTGELVMIPIKGLWSHFPIPAYKVLSQMKAWQAQRLLTCLISFMGGYNGLSVYPSYKTIASRSGLYPSAIKKQINLLEHLGFIKVSRVPHNGNTRNIYYLQESLWDINKMNAQATIFLGVTHECMRCGKGMQAGNFGFGQSGESIHFGCGGEVFDLSTPGGSADVRRISNSVHNRPIESVPLVGKPEVDM